MLIAAISQFVLLVFGRRGVLVEVLKNFFRKKRNALLQKPERESNAMDCVRGRPAPSLD